MRRILRAIALFCLVPATASSQTGLRPPARPVPLIVVLRRPGLQTYEQVTEEFRSRVRAEVRVLAVRRGGANQRFGTLRRTLTAEQQRLRHWLLRTRPNLIFAIGQTAYDFAISAQLSLPMVDAFVFHRYGRSDVDEKQGRAIAEAPPVQVVLLAFQRARPGLSKVAVLHSADTAKRFSAARSAAEAGSAPELVSFEARNPSHALRLLHKISRQPDLSAIWLFPDLRVLAPQVFQHAMDLQYRRRIPLMAATAIQVRQGALFALDYAPDAVARWAARIAEDVLFAKIRRRNRSRSHSAASLPLSPRLSISASTAGRLQIPLEAFADLSPEVLR